MGSPKPDLDLRAQNDTPTLDHLPDEAAEQIVSILLEYRDAIRQGASATTEFEARLHDQLVPSIDRQFPTDDQMASRYLLDRIADMAVLCGHRTA
jgi:hypothetical protein